MVDIDIITSVSKYDSFMDELMIRSRSVDTYTGASLNRLPDDLFDTGHLSAGSVYQSHEKRTDGHAQSVTTGLRDLTRLYSDAIPVYKNLVEHSSYCPTVATKTTRRAFYFSFNLLFINTYNIYLALYTPKYNGIRLSNLMT